MRRWKYKPLLNTASKEEHLHLPSIRHALQLAIEHSQGPNELISSCPRSEEVSAFFSQERELSFTWRIAQIRSCTGTSNTRHGRWRWTFIAGHLLFVCNTEEKSQEFVEHSRSVVHLDFPRDKHSLAWKPRKTVSPTSSITVQFVRFSLDSKMTPTTSSLDQMRRVTRSDTSGI